jgi:hypothetical protein
MAFSETKIQRWPFTGPIVIEETELEGKKEYFIVDNWCYLGNFVVDFEGNRKKNLQKSVLFDLDLYQILKQYLKKPKRENKLYQIPPDQLPQLLEDTPFVKPKSVFTN